MCAGAVLAVRCHPECTRATARIMVIVAAKLVAANYHNVCAGVLVTAAFRNGYVSNVSRS